MAERGSIHRATRTTEGRGAEAGTPVARPGQGSPVPRPPQDLHVCPVCESHLVQPVDWAQAGARGWRVELRCPDCEWRGGGTYDQDAVDRFDETLDRAMQTVLDDLQLLSRANMEEQAERFAAALHAGLVLPEDF